MYFYSPKTHAKIVDLTDLDQQITLLAYDANAIRLAALNAPLQISCVVF